METILDISFVVATLIVVIVFIIGGLFGFSLGLDRGKFEEMQRRGGKWE